MLYPLVRRMLFQLDPEKAHDLSLRLIGYGEKTGLTRQCIRSPIAPSVNVMGLNFPNQVGLAAGLDKNGECIDGLSALGFGFVEIGTVTPVGQPGNPKPRLFRIPERNAIINRMGFNNNGVDNLIAHVAQAKRTCILGINVGKNFATAVEDAHLDYVKCMAKVYPYADYITVNVSSPNTPGLRNLQFGDSIKILLEAVKQEQAALASEYRKYKPVAIKIAPDMEDDVVGSLAETFRQFEIDAVIATNTTISRDAVKGLKHSDEAGGLSGAPLFEQSTQVVRLLAAELGREIPVIAAGGIFSGENAAAKIAAGASLVQIYSGFIYRGPGLIREASDAIVNMKLQQLKNGDRS